jgi:zinc resistance-associated protein
VRKKGELEMKLRVTMVSMVSLITLLAVTAAYAGPCGMCPYGGGGQGKGQGIWSILTPEQQQQAKVLRLETMKKVQPLMAEMGKKRVEMEELTSKPNADEQAVQKKREEIWAIQDAMRNEQRAMSTKIRTLLTPEQKEKVGPMGFGCMGGRGGFGGPDNPGFGGRGMMGPGASRGNGTARFAGLN